MWLIASMTVTTALPLAAQNSARHNARDVHVRIETEKKTYRIGETLNVRLTLRNTSPNTIQFRASVPRSAVYLRVTDRSGRPLQANPRLGTQWDTGSWEKEVQLKAGEEQTLQWGDSEWMNLEDWGYRIEQPGKYVIVGAPYIWGDKVVSDKSIRSNSVKIEFVP
jgi:hypothetical protein